MRFIGEFLSSSVHCSLRLVELDDRHRIAKHFGSPRVQVDNKELYETFKNASVWTADHIFTTLTLEQDGQSYQVEIEDQVQRKVHIEYSSRAGLKICLPRDSEAQEESYLSSFPRRLLGWIMTPPGASNTSKSLDAAAVSILKSVLNARRSSLSWLLKQEGIDDVEFEDDFRDDAEPDSALLAEPVRPSTPRTYLSSNPLETPESLDESSPEYLIQYTPASSTPSFGGPGDIYSL
jgi:hypothetical protein